MKMDPVTHKENVEATINRAVTMRLRYCWDMIAIITQTGCDYDFHFTHHHFAGGVHDVGDVIKNEDGTESTVVAVVY